MRHEGCAQAVLREGLSQAIRREGLAQAGDAGVRHDLHLGAPRVCFVEVFSQTTCCRHGVYGRSRQ